MEAITIFAIVVIVFAAVAYCIGRADGWSSGCKEKKGVATLPSPVDTLSRVHAIKIPKHYLTRYIRMDKEDMHSTNDNIEALEDEGFTVDDYDTEDRIITMTKGVYEAPVEH